MYTRRYYRQTPPGYSGVAFSTRRETPSVTEEDGTLTEGQKAAHQKENRRMAPEGITYDGQKLAPILRGEEGGASFEKESVPTGASAEPTCRKTENEELIILGVILFLLGSGLDEESVLILLCMLVLLT